MNIREAFTSINVLKSAAPSSAASLLPYMAIKKYDKGDHVFSEKEELNFIYFLSQGVACTYKLDFNGEKRGLLLHGSGSMLSDNIKAKSAPAYCEILTSSTVLCIDSKHLIYACNHDFELTLTIMDSMETKLNRLYRQRKNTANTIRLDKRIAAKLLKLSRDYGVVLSEGVQIDFDLSITFLADLLGSRRETVSRQIKILSENNLIIFNNRRFTIPDREKLLNYYLRP